jgi:hypothetical protein
MQTFVMRLLFLLLFILSSITASAQQFTYPQVQQSGKTIAAFVPTGWMVLDKAQGDLNTDKLPDIALILQHKDSVTYINADFDTVKSQPRILVILFKNAAGTWQLAQQSNTFILAHDIPTMEDPYQSIKIEHGLLEISFQLFANMGGWDVTNGDYKFRYRDGNFILIGAENYTYNRANGQSESYSYNFLTHKRSYSKVGKAKRNLVRWKAVNVEPKTLANFKTPFTWNIEGDVYL